MGKFHKVSLTTLSQEIVGKKLLLRVYIFCTVNSPTTVLLSESYKEVKAFEI